MHKGEEEAYAAFVGIDWANKKHDICLWMPGQTKPERLVLEHRPEAIHAWAKQLSERFGGARVAVSIELQEGPIVWALLEHDMFVLFPVQPTTVARYRSAFRPSGAKDDPTDAEVILELLVRHRDKLQRLQPERPAVRSLRQLVETRRDLVHDRTRLTNPSPTPSRPTFPRFWSRFATRKRPCSRISSSAGRRCRRLSEPGARHWKGSFAQPTCVAPPPSSGASAPSTTSSPYTATRP